MVYGHPDNKRRHYGCRYDVSADYECGVRSEVHDFVSDASAVTLLQLPRTQNPHHTARHASGDAGFHAMFGLRAVAPPCRPRAGPGLQLAPIPRGRGRIACAGRRDACACPFSRARRYPRHRRRAGRMGGGAGVRTGLFFTEWVDVARAKRAVACAKRVIANRLGAEPVESKRGFVANKFKESGCVIATRP